MGWLSYTRYLYWLILNHSTNLLGVHSWILYWVTGLLLRRLVVFVVTVSLLYPTKRQAHACESLLNNNFREMIYWYNNRTGRSETDQKSPWNGPKYQYNGQYTYNEETSSLKCQLPAPPSNSWRQCQHFCCILQLLFRSCKERSLKCS